jgi:membrane-associated HD superfamily phosphohydrolase
MLIIIFPMVTWHLSVFLAKPIKNPLNHHWPSLRGLKITTGMQLKNGELPMKKTSELTIDRFMQIYNYINIYQLYHLSIKTIQGWSESSTTLPMHAVPASALATMLPMHAVKATGAELIAKQAVGGARHPTFAFSCSPLLLINAFSSLGASIKLCQDSTNLFISGFLLSCDILLLFWNPDR